MQIQPGQIHIGWRGGRIQTAENQTQPTPMLRLNSRLLPGCEEAFQALVLETLDHAPNRNLLRYTLQCFEQRGSALAVGLPGASCTR